MSRRLTNSAVAGRGLAAVHAAGHLGLWPALYAAAAMICFAQLAGLWRWSAAFGYAIPSVVLTAAGAYLLDRVKISPAFIDPADIASQPARYAFLIKHQWIWRSLAIACLVMGALMGLGVSRWAPLAAVLSGVGVLAYALRPRHRLPRVKDIVWIKNPYVAMGIVGFAGLAAVAAASPADRPADWITTATQRPRATASAAGIVIVRLMIDAALCDVDDESTDRRFGTATTATLLGGNSVRRWGVVASLLLAIAILVATRCPWPARLAWSASTFAGTAALLILRPDHLRDPVDIYFPLEAFACTVLMKMT